MRRGLHAVGGSGTTFDQNRRAVPYVHLGRCGMSEWDGPSICEFREFDPQT